MKTIEKEIYEYCDIKVSDTVKLFKKDGTYDGRVTKTLDRLIDKAHELGHTIIGEYTGKDKPIDIDLGCEHGVISIKVKNYIEYDYSCFRCRNKRKSDTLLGKQKLRNEFIQSLQDQLDNELHVNGFIRLDEYGMDEPIRIMCPNEHVMKLNNPLKFPRTVLIGCPRCIERERKEQGTLLN